LAGLSGFSGFSILGFTVTGFGFSTGFSAGFSAGFSILGFSGFEGLSIITDCPKGLAPGFAV